MSKTKKSGTDNKRVKSSDKHSSKKDSCGSFSLDGPFPYEDKMKRKDYRETLRKLQIELLHVQQWVKTEGQKIVILFEGRDAAGKGGTIKRFTEHLNPRGARVVALQRTDRSRARAVVFPAVHRQSAFPWRDRLLRSLLV